MRKLNYDNPGTPKDLGRFMAKLKTKSKSKLLIILKHVAESCDMCGKGYVDQFEDTVRRDIGYTRGEAKGGV